jgi:hypothetical protein
LAKADPVLVDPLVEVEKRPPFFLERRRLAPNALVIGANSRAELLDLGAQENDLEIGGVNCAIKPDVSERGTGDAGLGWKTEGNSERQVEDLLKGPWM